MEDVGYVSIQGEGLQYWTVHLDRFTHPITGIAGKHQKWNRILQTGVID